MARVVLIGGGCRGLALGQELVAAGHAVRISTRTADGRAQIEAVGAECWLGDPDVVGTLRLALENATVLCWLLGTAAGPRGALTALHGSRLDMMMSQSIDTTVRGLVYEAAGSVAPPVLARGARLVEQAGRRSQMPVAILRADPSRPARWVAEARQAVGGLLGAGAE